MAEGVIEGFEVVEVKVNAGDEFFVFVVLDEVLEVPSVS